MVFFLLKTELKLEFRLFGGGGGVEWKKVFTKSYVESSVYTYIIYD